MIHARTYWKVDEHQLASGGSGDPETGKQERVLVPEGEANVVSSRLVNDMHAPALDIDLPCQLVESSTPGHFHLFIEKEMTWEQYHAVLVALADAGIIERGYLSASEARQQTFLRKPGVTK